MQVPGAGLLTLNVSTIEFYLNKQVQGKAVQPVFIAEGGVACLRHCAVRRLRPHPVREVSEAALWGAVRRYGVRGNTVVVSDEAGQFRIPNHALR